MGYQSELYGRETERRPETCKRELGGETGCYILQNKQLLWV